MTKVEELRELLRTYLGDIEDMQHRDMTNEAIDSLIAAATEEGRDEGWAASKMPWTRMQQWNDEWREENPNERSLTLLDAIDLIEWKIAKARAEGAEETKPKIAESTDRLIQWILDMMPPYEGANPEWGKKVLLDLVATAAEAERKRIREGSQMVGVEKDGVNFIGGVDYVGSAFLVPIDVMDPTKEKK